MEPPDLDGRGKSQRNRARRPAEETAFGEEGPYLVDTLAEENKAAREALAPASKLAPLPDRVPDGDPRTVNKATRKRLVNTQEALALRAMGWSMADIAEHLGVGVGTVTGWFTEHRQALAAKTIDRDLDAIAAPLAKENLIHGLLAGDKDYTLETLKGRGFFRRHVAGETEVKHDLPPLVIRFEGAPAHVPEAGSHEKLVTGTVVGAKSLPPADTTRTTVVDAPVGVGVPSRPHDDP